MSLDVVIGLVGVIVTILVVLGMVLITPRGVESSHPPAEPPAINDGSTTDAASGRGPAPTDMLLS